MQWTSTSNDYNVIVFYWVGSGDVGAGGDVGGGGGAGVGGGGGGDAISRFMWF